MLRATSCDVRGVDAVFYEFDSVANRKKEEANEHAYYDDDDGLRPCDFVTASAGAWLAINTDPDVPGYDQTAAALREVARLSEATPVVTHGTCGV